MSALPTMPVAFARTIPFPSTTKTQGIVVDGQVASPSPNALVDALTGGLAMSPSSTGSPVTIRYGNGSR